MSQENVETVRRAYELFNRGDIDGMTGLLAPDFEYVTAGVVPGLGGVHRGADGLFMETFWNEFDAPHIEVHELIDAGDRVFLSVTLQGHGKQSGVDASFRIWQVVTMRDGLGVRGQTFLRRAEALEAAGLRE